MRAVSEHQARVYAYAKAQGLRWFTIQELSSEEDIPDGSAKNHAVRFEDAGVFERMRISPSHVFRISPSARRRHPELIKRLEQAALIFADRRQAQIARELSAISGQIAATTRASSFRAAVARPNKPAKGTRRSDELMDLLRRADGVSMEELVHRFGIQSHSIRALISVTTRERGVKAPLIEGRYRILG